MSTAAPPLPDAPYRGIEPFRFTDQQIFAARVDETWTLLSNVTLYRAVLLFGASGTGKSSLINAGLLPQALKENHVPDRLRVQPILGREIKVERIRMSGSEEQAAYLPSNFAPPESEASAESIELSLADFRARLEAFRPATGEAESEALFEVPRARPRPLLIFDQFEEFVTLFEEAQRVGTIEAGPDGLHETHDAQREILKTLVELIQDETLPIKIIFAFREDYFAKLSLLFEYCPELLDQAQRLLPPRIEALPQIIRAPFANSELRAYFLKNASTESEISEALAQKIAAELGRRSEGDTANLTELQIVCQRLWQASNAEELFRKDGIEGLLKSYGADVFLHFTPELRDAAVVLLSHMVTASNTRNIISEEDLLSRTTDCDFQPSQCTNALTALSRSQIVRREPRHSIYFYEITSEYLVPWIKERVAERKSVEEQRLAQEARRKLEEERSQAVAQFEAEKRRGRVMSRLLMAMAVLMIAVVILGWWGLKQYRQLHEHDISTNEEKKTLQRVQDAIKSVNSQNPDVVLQGIEQIDGLIKENKVPSELKNVLINPASTSQDDRVRVAANNALAQAAQTDNNLAQSIDNSARQLPLRFFIHIANESQRGQAQQVAAVLRKQGYLVPGIQNVGEKGVKNNQLRYFRDTEPGLPNVQEIIALLDKANVGKWNPNRVRGFEQSTKVAAGQFELWFASPETPPTGAESSNDSLARVTLRFVSKTPSRSSPKLSGRIRIYDSSHKLITDKTVEGDPEGNVEVSLKEGTYQVYVDFKGYLSDTRTLSIKAGQDQVVGFQMEERGRSEPPNRQRPN